jgi:hypothetical protein
MGNPNDEADGGIDPRLRCYQCKEVHPTAKIVTLPDGREMGTYQWEYRVYCEARYVLTKFRSKRTRQAYLSRIEEIRGQKMVDILKAEMLLQWRWKQGQKK